MKSRLFLVALIAFVVTGCSQQGVEYTSKFGPNADFTQYKTWNFAPAHSGLTGDQRLDDPRLSQLVEDVITIEMSERGYTRQLSEPDMMLNYQIAIDREVDEMAMEDADYGRTVNMPEMSWENGSLVVFIVDARTGSALWGGRAIAPVEPKLNRQQSSEKIKRIIGGLFSEFTPKTDIK